MRTSNQSLWVMTQYAPITVSNRPKHFRSVTQKSAENSAKGYLLDATYPKM